MKYEVRIGDDIVPADSVGALERMVRTKTLRAESLVRELGGPWLPARQVLALRRFFVVDAWEAWDELEDVEESSVVTSEPTPAPPRPPEPEEETDETPLLPEVAVESLEPDLETLDPAALQPLDVPSGGRPSNQDLPSLPMSAIEERGQVIDFPAPLPPMRGSRGGAEPARKLAPLLDPRPAPDARGPPPRWFALAGVVALTAMGVATWVWYVNSTANWTSLGDPEPAPIVETAQVDLVEVVPKPAGDELDALERELRQTMREGIVDVCTGDAEDIESAMLIELSRLKVRVADVDTTVYAWSHGQSPCPEILDLQATLYDRGELTRDLASVALVVGKYTQHHDWQLREFQVAFRDDQGELRGQSLDPERVRRFWGTELDLRQMLER